jgi:type I restriction enzyme S subunit
MSQPDSVSRLRREYALTAEGAEIKRFGRGSTHTTIYFPEVKALHICLPPVEEQREIVRRIAGLLPVAETIAKAVESAAKRTGKLTQAILATAFRGELVPTEAELALTEGRDYETAEQLLARVEVATTAPFKKSVRGGDRGSSRKVRRA